MQWPWFKAIPLAIRAQLNYRFQVSAPLSVIGYCRDYEPTLSGVILRDCVCDSSERMQGTLLKELWTQRDEMAVISTSTAVLKLSPEEIENFRQSTIR